MSRSPKKRISVVLDGSNIIHGGAGGKRGSMDGHRLVHAVALYKKYGYTVYPRIRKGTLHYMSGNFVDKNTKKKIPKAPGYDALKRMQKPGNNPRLFSYGKDDDLAIIELALSVEVDGWIVTNDTFDKHAYHVDKKGKVIPKERQIYSKEYDWDDIDSRLWGVSKSESKGYRSKSYYKVDETWHVEGSQFFHRGLKKAPFNLIGRDSFSIIRNELEKIEDSLDIIDTQSEKLDESELSILNRLKKEILHFHPHLRNIREILPEPSIPSGNDLKKLLVVDLKELCGQLGLKKSGRKSELIERLANHKDDS
jgi:hypothetical protein